MRRQTTTVASQTTSSVIPVDRNQHPFNLSFAVTLGGGTMTYTVQHTLDDVQDSSVTPKWFDHSSVAAKVNVDADGNYAYPIAAIRLNVTAYTSGTAKLTILQGKE